MIDYIEVDRDDVVAIRVVGKIRAADLNGLSARVEEKLARYDTIRAYVELDEFDGFSAEALFGDVQLAVNHLGEVERKAVVGGGTWLAIAVDAADQLFSGVESRHFRTQERDLALRWIQDGRHADALTVDSLDHVETFVPDLAEGRAWFERCFGLHELERFRESAGPAGPVMLSPDEGYTKIALFEGFGPDTVGHRLVAFRVDARAFHRFLDFAPQVPVHGPDGQPVPDRESLDVQDHEVAISVYFCDPWGNRYEVTTYEVEDLRDLEAL
jgi:catechol 2,3-dioxygenase-like lactoylglutathione lyase family enzyme